MEVSKEIKDGVKDTVGYNEAVNKESFIIGTQVGFLRSENFFNKEIKSIAEQRDFYKRSYEQTMEDIKVIAKGMEMINKYQDQP